MARLSKQRLLDIIVTSLEHSGWAITAISPGGAHPFRFEIEQDGTRVRVRAYIWNTTHGGASRSVDEFRIQITSGIDNFEREPEGITLILGWSEAYKVFAGFDIAYHEGMLGSSPSIQIGEATMALGAARGFAAQQKSNMEIAVAIRGDNSPTIFCSTKRFILEMATSPMEMTAKLLKLPTESTSSCFMSRPHPSISALCGERIQYGCTRRSSSNIDRPPPRQRMVTI